MDISKRLKNQKQFKRGPKNPFTRDMVTDLRLTLGGVETDVKCLKIHRELMEERQRYLQFEFFVDMLVYWHSRTNGSPINSQQSDLLYKKILEAMCYLASLNDNGTVGV